MDDPGFVRRGQTFGDLARDLQQLAHRQRTRLKQVVQGLALDELDHHVRDRLRSPDVIERDDVGMGESRSRACLALEALQMLPIGSEFSGQNLDGDLAPVARVARPVDLAHSSRAEWRKDLVRTETLS